MGPTVLYFALGTSLRCSSRSSIPKCALIINGLQTAWNYSVLQLWKRPENPLWSELRFLVECAIRDPVVLTCLDIVWQQGKKDNSDCCLCVTLNLHHEFFSLLSITCIYFKLPVYCIFETRFFPVPAWLHDYARHHTKQPSNKQQKQSCVGGYYTNVCCCCD